MIDGYTLNKEEIQELQLQAKIKREMTIQKRNSYIFSRFCFSCGLSISIIFILCFVTTPSITQIENFHVFLTVSLLFPLMTIIALNHMIKYEKNQEVED